MRVLFLCLWLAGFVQVAIASANVFIPRKLNYRENLSRVAPIIRQIFVVHSVYIVGVVLLFAVLTFGFAPELASGRGLGRFLAAAMALFWLFRAPVQLLYYDASSERQHWRTLYEGGWRWVRIPVRGLRFAGKSFSAL